MKLIATILGCFTSFLLFSQDYPAKFKDLYMAQDTAGQEKLLTAWSSEKPQDPELFVAWFNYYVYKSRKEVVSMDSVARNDNAIEVTDTATGKVVGYMNSTLVYNDATLKKGFDKINQGIKLHPKRLDMRFGRIYMLGQSGKYDLFTQSVIDVIEQDQTIKHAWLWKDGKPLEDPENFFLGSMQDYNATLYNTEDDNLLPNIRRISEAVLKYHPNHVESLANVAMTHLIVGENDKALVYLLKAEKIKAEDVVVLNNIAEAYKRKGDKVNAKLYYEKMIRYGTPEDIEYAQAKIKALE